MIRLALYQPDIPQNTGTLMRLAACLGVGLDLIGPLGFSLDEKRLRRAGMDYLDRLDLTRHESWDGFCATRAGRRLVLLSTKADQAYTDFAFGENDILIAGSESAGVPDAVHEAVDARIKVAMVGGVRSLNVAVAAAMVLGEGLRQTGSSGERQTGGFVEGP